MLRSARDYPTNVVDSMCGGSVRQAATCKPALANVGLHGGVHGAATPDAVGNILGGHEEAGRAIYEDCRGAPADEKRGSALSVTGCQRRASRLYVGQ